jgi:hypothetical protein
MAVSQRKFFPLLFLFVGIAMFAVFGFGTSDLPPRSQIQSNSNDQINRVGSIVQQNVEGKRQSAVGRDAGVVGDVTIDEAAINEAARQATGESVETNSGKIADLVSLKSSLANGTDLNQAPSNSGEESSQRLNLSGQTADNALTRSADGSFDITFDHIKFDIPEGESYSQTMLTDEIHRLDGQQVKLRGYIRPSFKQRDLKGFIFVRDNKECCFGPGAALFDCVVVKLAKDQATDYTTRPVAVTGTFVLKQYTGPDGNVWAIYRMKDAAVLR